MRVWICEDLSVKCCEDMLCYTPSEVLFSHEHEVGLRGPVCEVLRGHTVLNP